MNPVLHQQMQSDQARMNTMQINATKNAQRTNQTSQPDHDTPRAVARRKWLREARYTIEAEGFRAFFKGLIEN